MRAVSFRAVNLPYRPTLGTKEAHHGHRDEVTVAGAGAPGADSIRETAWVTSLRLDDTRLLRALRLELDPGESEAIACAVQLRADWLLKNWGCA